MSEYITTHNELLKLHGAKVTCKMNTVHVNDARISVDEAGHVFLCQNYKNGSEATVKFGYNYSWLISTPHEPYEDGDPRFTFSDIKVIETAKEYADEVIEELDERLDNLTPHVILNATKTWDDFTKVWNALYYKAEKINSVSTLEKFTRKVKELAE